MTYADLIEKKDFREIIYEAARKPMESARKMVFAEGDLARDAFYQETMRHLAMMSQQVGEWRLKCKMIEEQFKDE